MFEIDDFYVNNDISKIDLNKVKEKYNYFKNASIPESYLKKHFKVLLQENDNKTMYKKKESDISPLQKFWTLRFIDMAENNYDNLLKNNYSLIDKNDLKKIINISKGDNVIYKIKKYLLEKGIHLYFLDSLPRTYIDGAVYLTSYSTIAIGLTLRFERLDYILFTLLHELSHIIIHNDYLSDGLISIEDSQEEIEMEANRFAKDMIISPQMYRVCLPKKTRETNDLIDYADEYNISPILLAGIIRRDLNNYQIFNEIINNSKISRCDFL